MDDYRHRCDDCGRYDCERCGTHICLDYCDCMRSHHCPCECTAYDRQLTYGPDGWE
ncbi:hypothetical protein [Streptomyces sp. XY431]|uniref:hypothetical protein n=1 Tax=Streptomyces sp. XY431 TaxID=1415562 RepID=UPI000AB52DFC|nr:hypothetical protein [Streptomyces sp. XY431]